MADVERITPPVPTLPAPIGRGVGSRRRQSPRQDRKPQPKPEVPETTGSDQQPDHIDEYV